MNTQAVTAKCATFDLDDVPPVSVDALNVAFDHLLQSGHGLAFLKGLDEAAFGRVDDVLWQAFAHDDVTRIATSLRLRALVGAFGSRRLQDLLLHKGFSMIQRALLQASELRLNIRYGFNLQRLVLALGTEPAIEQPMPELMPIAA